MNRPAIQVTKLVKTFREHVALNDVCVSFESGKIHGIVGRNGSGKSVLLKCICGILIPDSGEIFIRGIKRGNDDAPPKGLGIIIEQPGFIPQFSGRKNLSLLAGLTGIASEEDIANSLELVGLADVGKKKTAHYSMGMKQRLGLAQALMERPDILILDEPFSGLDRQGMHAMHLLFRDIKSRGTTIIITTHYMEDVHMLCDTCYEMENGIISDASHIIGKAQACFQ